MITVGSGSSACGATARSPHGSTHPPPALHGLSGTANFSATAGLGALVTLRIPLSHATARKGWRQRHTAVLSPGKAGKGRTLFARMEQAMRR